jgi:triacylglycerol lipase
MQPNLQLLDPSTSEPMIRSRVAGPIESLSFLRRALLFAELAEVCYYSRAVSGELAHTMGFPETRYYEMEGAQAYIFANEHDAVITCRGTEPHEWADIETNLDAVMAVAESVGRVHRGFKSEVDRLWPRLEQALVSNTRPVWFTGHSLGGAMAAICAGRCRLSFIQSNPRALFTFGSPRIGNRKYVNHVRLEYYRFVNNNDIVPQVPPTWAGYRHSGNQVYIDSDGRVGRTVGWRQSTDRWRGFWRSLRKLKLDHFVDHAIGAYVEAIRNEVEREDRNRISYVLQIRDADIPLPTDTPVQSLPLRRAA